MMKEILEPLTLREKNVADNQVTILELWNDNYIDDNYLDDTIGLSIKEVFLDKNGGIDRDNDYISFAGVWLTKNQCIILKNHLDSFIQLAETWEEIDAKLQEKEGTS